MRRTVANFLKKAKSGNHIKESSGAPALSTVQQLKQRNAALALVIVDQRMPDARRLAVVSLGETKGSAENKS